MAKIIGTAPLRPTQPTYARAFLENCLNDGFLGASNRDKMQFYIMWANHDANYTWDKRNAGTVDQTIWRGAVTREQFTRIGTRWLTQYFTRPNYYKIDGKPVVSIYELNNFVNGLGGVEEACRAMQWLNEEATRYGLPGVHFQFVRWDGKISNHSGVDGKPIENESELVNTLGFGSVTNYQFVHYIDIDREYADIMAEVPAYWDKWTEKYPIPYFPHISVGWDNNPRFQQFWPGVMRGNTPEAIEKGMRMAKEFIDTHELPAPLITVNSWNEWTETSYLEPDDLYGYGYLEAIKKVFVEE